MTRQLTLIKPDDWHIHLRDGAALATTVPHAAAYFSRAIIMPNLNPSIKTVVEAQAYQARIMAALPKDASFTPLMTLYLTQDITTDTIVAAKTSAMIHGLKLYPAGVTTNSHEGVANIEKLYPTFEAMSKYDLPLLIHGEVIDPNIDIFDREAVFIERHLAPLHQAFPELRIVVEHISTQEATQFVLEAGPTIAATITPQHLLYNRNALLLGGLKPHYYCLPILKRERHRQALCTALTLGSSKFFIGTDSAPHARSTKEAACGCAGCYSATTALSLYTQIFDSMNALEHLEAFLSTNGPDFYGLPRNTQTITLVESPYNVRASYPYLEDEHLIPLGANEVLNWQIRQ